MTDTEQTSAVLAPPANPDLRWYVVHAYSGMEKAVERNITERIQQHQFAEHEQAEAEAALKALQQQYQAGQNALAAAEADNRRLSALPLVDSPTTASVGSTESERAILTLLRCLLEGVYRTRMPEESVWNGQTVQVTGHRRRSIFIGH